MKRQFSSCIVFHAVLSFSSVRPRPAPAASCDVAKGTARSGAACSEAAAGSLPADFTLVTPWAGDKREPSPVFKLSRWRMFLTVLASWPTVVRISVSPTDSKVQCFLALGYFFDPSLQRKREVQERPDGFGRSLRNPSDSSVIVCVVCLCWRLYKRNR